MYKHCFVTVGIVCPERTFSEFLSSCTIIVCSSAPFIMTWRMTSGNLKFSAHNGGQEKKSRGRGAILSESEKKRRRKVLLSNINKTRIYIGSEIGRWNELRDTLEGKTHMETARFLLDQ